MNIMDWLIPYFLIYPNHGQPFLQLGKCCNKIALCALSHHALSKYNILVRLLDQILQVHYKRVLSILNLVLSILNLVMSVYRIILFDLYSIFYSSFLSQFVIFFTSTNLLMTARFFRHSIACYGCYYM